jgi:hypothetical protein
LKYRGDLCSILVASSSSDSAEYSFADPKITKYEDLAGLQKTLTTAFKKSKISTEDLLDVEKIYISLTKNEHWRDESYPEAIHWLAKTFDHAPAISALTSISMLQKEVLSARRMAISSIINRQ